MMGVHEVANELLTNALGPKAPETSSESHPVSEGTDENVFYGMHPHNATMPNSAFTGVAPNGDSEHAVMATLKTADNPIDSATRVMVSFVTAYENKGGRFTDNNGDALPLVWKDAAITVAMRYVVPFNHEKDAGLDEGRFADTYENAKTWETEQKIDWMEGSEAFQMKISYTELPRKASTEHTLIRRQIDAETGEIVKEKRD
jgi:hypothetical protein